MRNSKEQLEAAKVFEKVGRKIEACADEVGYAFVDLDDDEYGSIILKNLERAARDCKKLARDEMQAARRNNSKAYKQTAY